MNSSGDLVSSGADSNGAEPDDAGTERYVAIMGAHEREVFSYIYSLTGNWDDAQEVMQRVRIRIWKQFNQYDEEKPFGAWARAIAYYLVLAFRKEKSRKREYFCEGVLEAVSQSFAETNETLEDRREALAGCLAKLKSEQRNLVNDYYSRNAPVAQLAESVGMTHGALRQSLFRIRKILLRCVEKTLKANSLEI